MRVHCTSAGKELQVESAPESHSSKERVTVHGRVLRAILPSLARPPGRGVRGYVCMAMGQMQALRCPIRAWSSVTFSYLPGVANVISQQQERLALSHYGKE